MSDSFPVKTIGVDEIVKHGASAPPTQILMPRALLPRAFKIACPGSYWTSIKDIRYYGSVSCSLLFLAPGGSWQWCLRFPVKRQFETREAQDPGPAIGFACYSNPTMFQGFQIE